MKDLLTFVKTRRKEGDFGRFALDVGDDVTSYVDAVNLLSWLKQQKRFGNENDLTLTPEYTWCRSVPVLLATDPSLSRLFECVEGRVRFKADIPAEERNTIRELADSEYRPIPKP